MFIVLSSHFCTRAAFCQPFNKRILYCIVGLCCIYLRNELYIVDSSIWRNYVCNVNCHRNVDKPDIYEWSASRHQLQIALHSRPQYHHWTALALGSIFCQQRQQTTLYNLTAYYAHTLNILLTSCRALDIVHNSRQPLDRILHFVTLRLLPPDIPSSASLSIFCQRLKAHLFHQSFPDVLLQ